MGFTQRLGRVPLCQLNNFHSLLIFSIGHGIVVPLICYSSCPTGSHSMKVIFLKRTSSPLRPFFWNGRKKSGSSPKLGSSENNLRKWLSSVWENSVVMKSKLSKYKRVFGLFFLFQWYKIFGSSSLCEEINILAKNVMVAAAPKPLHCDDSPPLMRVGATPRRVAPGQCGLWEMMKSHNSHWIAPRWVWFFPIDFVQYFIYD